MKILYYSDLFLPFIGGNESFLANIESRLNGLGHSTLHITSRINDTLKDEIKEWNGNNIPIKRTWIPFRNDFLGKGRYFFPFNYRKAGHIAKDYDLILATTFIAGLSGWRVGKIAKKPCLLFCHEMFRALWKDIGENVIQKKIYPKVEEYIASKYNYYMTCSEYGKRTLIDAGVNPEKIVIINHGVDDIFNSSVDGSLLRKELKLENNLLFGFTGRLKIKGTGQSKGLPYLLQAAKLVFKELPDARLVLGGTDFDSLKPLINELDISDKVIYAGKRDYKDVPKFHSMCDVMVGASIAEGFGIYYAEASRCGKAVVATTGGAIPEIIKHKETGLLSEPKDYETMAKNIIKLLSDKKLRDNYGQAGAEYTKKFNWDISAKRHLEEYEKILSNR